MEVEKRYKGVLNDIDIGFIIGFGIFWGVVVIAIPPVLLLGGIYIAATRTVNWWFGRKLPRAKVVR
jgi:uncharacterized membrane protein (Fun14 family)